MFDKDHTWSSKTQRLRSADPAELSAFVRETGQITSPPPVASSSLFRVLIGSIACYFRLVRTSDVTGTLPYTMISHSPLRVGVNSTRLTAPSSSGPGTLFEDASVPRATPSVHLRCHHDPFPLLSGLVCSTAPSVDHVFVRRRKCFYFRYPGITT